jgi:hypothetical protein
MAVIVPVVVGSSDLPEEQDLSIREDPRVIRLVVLGSGKDGIEETLSFDDEIRQLLVGLAKDDAAPIVAKTTTNVLSVRHEKSLSLTRSTSPLIKRLPYGTAQE